MSLLHIYCDGGSRANPGPAAAGIVGYEVDPSGDRKCVFEKGIYLQDKSNNYAEYYALLSGLEYALSTCYNKVGLFSDSKLIVEQMNGVWKVKAPDLSPLHKIASDKCKQLRAASVDLTINWVPREQNQHADSLANLAMDRHSDAEYKHNTGAEQQMEAVFNAMLRHEQCLRDLQDDPKRSKIADAIDSFNDVTKAWAAVHI